jgi:hypothetical protein
MLNECPIEIDSMIKRTRIVQEEFHFFNNVELEMSNIIEINFIYIKKKCII